MTLASATFTNSGVWNIRGYSNFTNTNTITNTSTGTIVISGVSGLTPVGTGSSLAITNSNVISVNPGAAAFIGGAVSGTGSFSLGGLSELEFAGLVGSGQTILFNTGNSQLTLDDPTHFSGAIGGLFNGDIIALQNFSISSLTPSGSTLTVNGTNTTTGTSATLNLSVSGALTQSTFSVLYNSASGSEILVVPTAGTFFSGPSGSISLPSSSTYDQLSGVTISEGTAIGVSLANQDSSSNTYFVNINQPSSIAVTGGAFNAINVATGGANIAVVNAGSVSSAGAIGIFTKLSKAAQTQFSMMAM